MILSDRTIREEIKGGRIVLEPFDDSMVQPSSVDVRLDRYFRVFLNHTMPVIDLKRNLEELTRLVEIDAGDPDRTFILHPGEFVLGSTLERVALPDDTVGRIDGKALSIDTEIPTPDGWVVMEDLQVGDQIFGIDGRPVRIVDATDVMLGRPCFEVWFSDGTSVIADASHQWLTRDAADRRSRRIGRVRTTLQIAGTLMRSDREYMHRVPLCAPVEYQPKALPIDPYVLGAWLGDGTSAQAVITSADLEILQEIECAGYAVVEAAGPLAYRIGGVGHTRDTATGRYTRNDSLSSRLRDGDLLGNEHIPDAYMQGSVVQRQALLEGLMDTDGYADKLGRCEFTSTRPGLANQVRELVASLGFERARSIVGVRPVDSVPVRCVQVDSPDGLFLVTRSYIPTHNSSLGRLGLLIHSTAGFIDPGFDGHITLELSNVASLPITLYPGMKIGQISFLRMTTPADVPYGATELGSKYQGQRGPTPSRYWENFET